MPGKRRSVLWWRSSIVHDARWPRGSDGCDEPLWPTTLALALQVFATSSTPWSRAFWQLVKVYIVSSPMVCTSWPNLFYHPAFKFLHCMHVSYFYAPSRSLRWRLARGVMAWDSHWIYPGACDAFLKQKWTFTNLNSCFFRERSSHSKKKNDGLSLSAVSILPDAHTIILQCTFITVSFFFEKFTLSDIAVHVFVHT